MGRRWSLRVRCAAQIPIRTASERVEAKYTSPLGGLHLTDRYDWLCNHGHLDMVGLAREINHRDAYCAMAFVSWLVAILTEDVCGVPFATWPTLPADLPWEQPAEPRVSRA